jgi:hypothetical protein
MLTAIQLRCIVLYMTKTEMQETIRQMLNDWNSATDDQRAEALAIAAARAAAV